MPLRNLVWLLMVPALVALGLAVSYSAPPPEKDFQRVHKLVDVMDEVEQNFYRPLSDKEWKAFVENMINGGLHELDPHSQYFNNEQLKEFQADSEGSFGGVGIKLDFDRDAKFPKVDHPMPDTPAYEAGIMAGDLIVKVGDRSAAGMSTDDVRKLITGEPGTQVTLTIRRDGRDPADEAVTLTRGVIPQHPVTGVRRRADDPGKWEWFADKASGIGYVHVLTFNELTTKELKAAVEEIDRDGGRALVLDLRNNGGGLLNQAIDVCSLFLSEGKPIVSTHGRDPEKARNFTVKKGTEIFRPADQRPIVVLMNDQSASASEIVASALQDNHRAVVVGERSYGKGSVQKLLYLNPDGDEKAAVKLTTETYWRPSGRNMDRRLVEKETDEAKRNEWGVMPDVEVKTTREDRARAEIEWYRNEWLAGKSAVASKPPVPSFARGPDGKPVLDLSKPYEDKPLNAAIETLKKKLGGTGAAPPQPGRLVPS
jgi:carboxyl-terminal processing protease